ncbi:MAG: plastocyanin/azurin family copper-binding protein [Candidatus Methanoperedens sp.]|nr:plastocyanin/azurin family copper-binding protein [Candidatus Methanoperedens sp.]
MRTRLLIALLIAAVLISGCTGQNTEPKTDVIPATTNYVEIKDFYFVPAEITVAKSTTVTWKNMGTTPHSVVSIANAVSTVNAFSSETLTNGETFMHTFNETGTFDYVCGLHARMKGKVVVT